MKKRILISIGLASCLIAGTILAGCSNSSSSQTAQQTANVTRGDINIYVSANGNLAYARIEDLAFETAGTVKDVLVEVGDNVQAGQELVRLDIEEWTDNVTDLERAVSSANLSVLQAEINVINARIKVEKDLGVYDWSPIKVAQADLDAAKAYYNYCQENIAFAASSGQETFWRSRLASARTQVSSAQSTFDALMPLVDNEQLENDRKSLVLMEGRLEDAKIALEDAKQRLEKARAASPIVKAPFSGYISAVNYSGGEEVNKGAIAVQLVDPTKFKASILVGESNIFSVQEGRDAFVQVSSNTFINLPAVVTDISPTAIIQSGVVNYAVEVELKSLQPVQGQGNFQRPSGQSGTTRQGQSQSRVVQRLPGTGFASGQTLGSFQLRQGLAVTVSIPLQQKKDVLLIPNRAVIKQGQNVLAKVIKDGKTEARQITIGLADSQNTEVLSGLAEGEVVAVTPASSSGQSQQIFFNTGPGGVPPPR